MDAVLKALRRQPGESGALLRWENPLVDIETRLSWLQHRMRSHTYREALKWVLNPGGSISMLPFAPYTRYIWSLCRP